MRVLGADLDGGHADLVELLVFLECLAREQVLQLSHLHVLVGVRGLADQQRVAAQTGVQGHLGGDRGGEVLALDFVDKDLGALVLFGDSEDVRVLAQSEGAETLPVGVVGTADSHHLLGTDVQLPSVRDVQLHQLLSVAQFHAVMVALVLGLQHQAKAVEVLLLLLALLERDGGQLVLAEEVQGELAEGLDGFAVAGREGVLLAGGDHGRDSVNWVKEDPGALDRRVTVQLNRLLVLLDVPTVNADDRADLGGLRNLFDVLCEEGDREEFLVSASAGAGIEARVDELGRAEVLLGGLHVVRGRAVEEDAIHVDSFGLSLQQISQVSVLVLHLVPARYLDWLPSFDFFESLPLHCILYYGKIFLSPYGGNLRY